MPQSQSWKWIPTHLTIEQFEEFVLPHLYLGSRGPQPKLSLHVIFNYRKTPKPGRKRLFVTAIFQERFRTIERVFAWEDKFKRLLLRFERISELHYALKSLALLNDQSSALLSELIFC